MGRSVKVKKLYSDAIIPTYAHKGDAGADLHAYEDVVIEPGKWFLVSTGISIAMPIGWVGLIHPRSGLAWRRGVTVLNAPGTIDSGYRGEIKVNLISHGSVPFYIYKGDRIAQIVFQRYEQADFFEVNDLEVTERGEGGHGSTGGINGTLEIQENKN